MGIPYPLRIIFTMAILLSLTFVQLAQSIDPIVIKGAKMFNAVTGQQFYVRGLDYQPSRDPLADVVGITRDLPYLKQLGINALRVYQAWPTPTTAQVMKILEDNGIYIILDVTDPKNTINRIDPSWRTTLFDALRSRVDGFIHYPNLLAFIAGNEVSNQVSNTPASAFVKASIRDLKAYIKALGKSTPVGYATADVTEISVIKDYFDCGTREEANDFYGINIYRWCGNTSTFQSSGYKAVTETFATWDVPSLLTEYGCNIIRPRAWAEVASIYGPDMQDVFSGGLVYEYSEETNRYGLVVVNNATSVTTLPDFDNLKMKFDIINPQGTTLDEYVPTNLPKPCPPITSKWLASSVLPPIPNNGMCKCMRSQLECRLIANDPNNVPPGVGDQIANALGYVCGLEGGRFCNDIRKDATLGSYGKYSMCDSLSSASKALDNYYKANKNNGATCNFGGIAELVVPTDTTTDCTLIPIEWNDHQSTLTSSSTHMSTILTSENTVASSSNVETKGSSTVDEMSTHEQTSSSSVISSSSDVVIGSSSNVETRDETQSTEQNTTKDETKENPSSTFETSQTSNPLPTNGNNNEEDETSSSNLLHASILSSIIMILVSNV